MMHRALSLAASLLIASCLLAAAGGVPTRQQLAIKQAQLPLRFEPNVGQVDGRVKFLARGAGYGVYLAAGEAVLTMGSPQSVVRMKLLGANTAAHVSGLEQLEGKSNYFIGRDSNQWRTNVPTYNKVRYERIYRGIDLIYYGNGSRLEYDFVVAPHTDPRLIRMRFDGTTKIEIAADGDLLLQTESGPLRQERPRVYQEWAGRRHDITAT